MLEGFKMEISTDDMLRIINHGVSDMAQFGLSPKLVEKGDRVASIQYSRDSKRYTLVFESGRKIKVVDVKPPQPHSMERSGSSAGV